VLPGVARKHAPPGKHPDPPLDARRLSDWVNAGPFTQSHGASNAHRTLDARMAAPLGPASTTDVGGVQQPQLKAANDSDWNR